MDGTSPLGAAGLGKAKNTTMDHVDPRLPALWESYRKVMPGLNTNLTLGRRAPDEEDGRKLPLPSPEGRCRNNNQEEEPSPVEALSPPPPFLVEERPPSADSTCTRSKPDCRHRLLLVPLPPGGLGSVVLRRLWLKDVFVDMKSDDHETFGLKKLPLFFERGCPIDLSSCPRCDECSCIYIDVEDYHKHMINFHGRGRHIGSVKRKHSKCMGNTNCKHCRKDEDEEDPDLSDFIKDESGEVPTMTLPPRPAEPQFRPSRNALPDPDAPSFIKPIRRFAGRDRHRVNNPFNRALKTRFTSIVEKLKSDLLTNSTPLAPSTPAALSGRLVIPKFEPLVTLTTLEDKRPTPRSLPLAPSQKHRRVLVPSSPMRTHRLRHVLKKPASEPKSSIDIEGIPEVRIKLEPVDPDEYQ
ncbi:unnamed protein product [Cyprideis torosa]|uniref:Uncharacterized protein n=1 Tax=Cyprideis torosa TaxID=163714 RepID=A0A7R8ZKH5_9CRUS|nr:unnamed protein product [Cyprideis torosa]CAG0884471.1 unnamed protein product [Cyprideis torosa]